MVTFDNHLCFFQCPCDVGLHTYHSHGIITSNLWSYQHINRRNILLICFIIILFLIYLNDTTYLSPRTWPTWFTVLDEKMRCTDLFTFRRTFPRTFLRSWIEEVRFSTVRFWVATKSVKWNIAGSYSIDIIEFYLNYLCFIRVNFLLTVCEHALLAWKPYWNHLYLSISIDPSLLSVYIE